MLYIMVSGHEEDVCLLWPQLTDLASSLAALGWDIKKPLCVIIILKYIQL